MLDCSHRRGGVNRIMMVRDDKMVGVLKEGDTLMLLGTYTSTLPAGKGKRHNMTHWRILAKGQEAIITVTPDAQDSLRLVARA